MDLNRVVFTGNLTSDPELRALPSGASVCSMRVACNTMRKNGDGDWVSKPNYINVSVFGGSGENTHRYLTKGSRVGIDGRLDWREWETPEGGKRSALDVVADTVQFLSNKGDAESSPDTPCVEAEPTAPAEEPIAA
jgi:single-strand DNA-binding protein